MAMLDETPRERRAARQLEEIDRVPPAESDTISDRTQRFLELAQRAGNIGCWVCGLDLESLFCTSETYRLYGLPENASLTARDFAGLSELRLQITPRRRA